MDDLKSETVSISEHMLKGLLLYYMFKGTLHFNGIVSFCAKKLNEKSRE